MYKVGFSISGSWSPLFYPRIRSITAELTFQYFSMCHEVSQLQNAAKFIGNGNLNPDLLCQAYWRPQ